MLFELASKLIYLLDVVAAGVLVSVVSVRSFVFFEEHTDILIKKSSFHKSYLSLLLNRKSNGTWLCD